MKRPTMLLVSAVWAAFSVDAADWNEWRGPQRNGLAEKSPPLLDIWPAASPKKIWESEEKIPGGEQGGYGSVVVADGRVYCLSCPVTQPKTGATQPPAARNIRDNLIFCLDANTGKTLWQKNFPGREGEHGGASSTPCVVNGKCYVIATDGAVYCLDAKTGDKVWEGKAGATLTHCSFVVADGVAVIPAGPLTGFDANNGKVLWAQEKISNTWSSPVLWKHEGKTYVIVRSGDLFCADIKTGGILWTCKDFQKCRTEDSTPIIIDDRMAVWNSYGVHLFKLAATKPELLWDVKCLGDYGSSPLIYNGYVYALGRRASLCIEMQTGKIAWQKSETWIGNYASPICADNKIFVLGNKTGTPYGDGALVMAAATSEKAQELASAPLALLATSTPAFVDGRLFCRLPNRIVCYDLRK